MEIFMQNIPASFRGRDNQIKEKIAQVLHSPSYAHHSQTPLNFAIHIFRNPGRLGLLQGALTMPTADVACQFLTEFGGLSPSRTLEGLRIRFTPSRNTPRPQILEEIRRLPYIRPSNDVETIPHGNQSSISVRTIQFGWACRDQVFSVEWERHGGCQLVFDAERREFQVQVQTTIMEVRMIVVHASQIDWGAAGTSLEDGRMPVIFLSLLYPPSFESKSNLLDLFSELFSGSTQNSINTPSHKRLTAFDECAHIPPQISIGLRLVCQTEDDIRTFRSLCNTTARINLDYFMWPIEYRELFSPAVMELYSSWVEQLDWPVAFQIEAMARMMVINIKEILDLRSEVEMLASYHGTEFTAIFLRHLITELQSTLWYTDADDIQSSTLSVKELFQRSLRDYTPSSQVPISRPTRTVPDTFECFHVTLTPTSLYPLGPFPERSNRVMRQYSGNTDSFIRVTFADENGLQFRFDREIDSRSLIHKRIGGVLATGFIIAGRKFDFLAYSQSALKGHAVYFVKPFIDGEHGLANAQTIISALGTFSNLAFDPDLIRCPARYGARISQAFTATDSSVSVEAEEMFTLQDITRYESCFTDGVGTISTELARAIWKDLRHKNRRSRKAIRLPKAFQIRFQGSKGVLSVDYALQGRAICIRPSMIKFEAPSSTMVEIARAFDRPGKYFLNRPLIMILDGLGVPYKVFQDLQDAAVEEAQESVLSLDTAGRLLEGHGLGNSFRVPSVMLSLHKLGLDPLEDDFWRQMMDFSINHVLRELKYHTRIPVPQGWTLVGVADIHGYLQEREVFVCIIPSNGSIWNPTYLEGPVLVSRSPTIHPGDVQVVRAIGQPPPGSPFEREPLYNTIVFSIRGERSLPSCLGGGDLDGDEYNVTTFLPLHPPRSFPPAPYKPSVKKLLDRHSTMADVADFVTEFIYSDNIGIIATTWLIIADQSDQHIFDPDCLLLAALHSDAVDYPKTGQPVPLGKLPKLKMKKRPDWNAPETARYNKKGYYESWSAIGRLCRAIDLPALPIAAKVSRQRRQLEDGESLTLEDVIYYVKQDELHDDDPVQLMVQWSAGKFISVLEYDDAIIRHIWQLYQRYAADLMGICIMYTLSRAKSAMLTEAEAVIGTIVAQSSQPSMRRRMISQLREQTAVLIAGIHEELAGEEDEPLERTLERAWVAYRIAVIEQDVFGARSFAWVAMAEIFATIKAIGEEQRTI